VSFSWAEWPNAEDLHEKMLPVYDEECLSRKGFQNWVETFPHGRSKVADNETGMRKWLKQQSTNFYAVGWDTLLK
jgi:hypothetical protein